LKILKSKELKSFRETLLKAQNNIDPILNLPIINPVLDHNHDTGNVRQVLDRESNQFLGKLESNFKRFIRWKFPNVSLQEVLTNTVQYLNRDYLNTTNIVIHPNHVLKTQRKFNNLKVSDQHLILKEANIEPGKTKKDNLKLYKKLIDENS
jgi:hypothetical protein